MEFIKLLIGRETIQSLIAFIFFALFGMLFVKLWRYNRKKKKGLRSTPPVFVNFNIKIWLNDNLIDFVLAGMVSFSCFRFFPDALMFLNKYFPSLPEFSDKMFYGLLLGFFFQYLFHKIMNIIKIN